jgi:hypothetical protein
MNIVSARELTALQFANNGRAVLMHLKQQDGNTIGLEVERSTLPDLIKALMVFAQRDGEQHPPPLPLPETAHNEALLLPCEEIATQTAPEGLWVKLRVGSLDLSVALPGKSAAKALGESLLLASKS